MNRRLRQLGVSGLLVGSLLLGGPAPGGASHESFAVYEDWTAPTIRSERWTGLDNPAQEIRREVELDHKLLMRIRRAGTASSTGFTAAFNRLTFTQPGLLDQVEADFEVAQLTLEACASNLGQPSRVFGGGIVLNKFNDGSGGPGNATGDHLVTINTFRESNSPDPEGVLRIRGGVSRCIDAVCSNFFSIPGGFVDIPDTVLVGEPFTLRVTWDSPNDRFLVGVGAGPDVPISYDPVRNQGPAGLPFADIRILALAANCADAPTAADVAIKVGDVRVNASGVIPLGP